MNFISDELEQYSNNHSSAEDLLLQKITRDTHLKVMLPRMLSGKTQGLFLEMISCMIKPTAILEIGTFTGYSALCLAKGLQSNGRLITIDINAELQKMVSNYFNESLYKNQIDYKIGNAMDVIPTLSEEFDLVFIDADKINYRKYYDLIFDKVKKGGFIIADNVLWSGKVLMDENKMDKDTIAIHQFNQYIQADTRTKKVLLPLRDGLTLIRKL